MADEDVLKRLEARLTRLEAALTQQPGQAGGGGTTAFPPGGVVVDPAPWGGGWYPYPRWPRWPWPHPIVDQGPFPNPVVDSAPIGINAGGLGQAATATTAATFGRVGPIGDPPPIDVSRFSRAQLEGALHSINSERARLNSLETLIKSQMERAQG